MAANPIALEPLRRRLREHPRWRWYALLVVASGMMVSVVNVSIVNVALPLMADDLGVDAATIGWVVTGYLITQATLLPIAGRASDIYGRRRIFVLGLVALLVGSALCAVAPNAHLLIAFRVLQGAGAAVMPPIAFASVGELFSPRERGRAMGIVVSIISTGPVIALVLSGVLVSVAGWRSLFWFTPPFAAVALAGAFAVLPSPNPRRPDARFDFAGAALAAGGLFPMLLALSRGAVWGWAAPPTLGLFALALVMLAIFALHESRHPDPMIDLEMLRLRSIRTANLASASGGAALFGILLVLPFYMAAVLGYGPVRLAIGILPVALTYMVVSPLAGRGVNAVGADRVAMTGYAVAALGTVSLVIGAAAETYLALLPGIVLLSAGLALATAPITVVAISEVPAARLGVASSFPNISRYTGGAFGAAILGSVLTASAQADGVRYTSAEIAHRVADGFSHSVAVALVFLAVALLAAWRMPGSPGADGDATP